MTVKRVSKKDPSYGPYNPGDQVLILTLTHYVIGRVTHISQVNNYSYVHLEDSSWVADTGRWANALATGYFEEVEVSTPGNVAIALNQVVGVYPWNHHSLPKETK